MSRIIQDKEWNGNRGALPVVAGVWLVVDAVDAVVAGAAGEEDATVRPGDVDGVVVVGSEATPRLAAILAWCCKKILCNCGTFLTISSIFMFGCRMPLDAVLRNVCIALGLGKAPVVPKAFFPGKTLAFTAVFAGEEAGTETVGRVAGVVLAGCDAEGERPLSAAGPFTTAFAGLFCWVTFCKFCSKMALVSCCSWKRRYGSVVWWQKDKRCTWKPFWSNKFLEFKKLNSCCDQDQGFFFAYNLSMRLYYSLHQVTLVLGMNGQSNRHTILDISQRIAKCKQLTARKCGKFAAWDWSLIPPMRSISVIKVASDITPS